MSGTKDGQAQPETCFAPAHRAGAEQLHLARESVLADAPARALLEAIPELLMVLNPQRQIVAASRHLLRIVGHETADAVVGLRPGELVGCVHCDEYPGGCGTSPSCDVCGAVLAILECLEQHHTVEHECRIRTRGDRDGGALELLAQAAYMRLGASEYVVLALRDVSAQKRRSVLERAFFHDILNIVAGLQALAELLSLGADEDREEQYRRDLRRLSEQVAAEITAHRELIQAENGELQPRLRAVDSAGALHSVAEMYRHHSVADGRHIEVAAAPRVAVEADPVLLQRVLGNLLKNALEATPAGGTVSLAAEPEGDDVRLSVSNPTVMAEDVQKQVFQRSFSTKAGSGRGVGTHSVRLLTERYMGGRVGLTSRDPEGTVFTVRLPRAAER